MKKNFNFEYLNQGMDDELIKKSKLIKTNDFTIGAITSRGTNKKRQKNQDYSLIMTNKNLAMMLIVDGKDDIENSDLAAQILTEQLYFWFKNLPKSYINTPIVLESSLFGSLRRINSDLYRYYKPGKVSFALAIKGKKDTVIANVGNCRAYTINDEIKLQTTDNLAWYEYNDKSLITSDEIKFLRGKDYVTRGVGGYPNDKHYFEPYIKIISNKDYDSLVLTSHGITDVLDSSDILYYLQNDNLDQVLDDIINKAIFSNPKELPNELLQKFKDMKKENMLIENTIPGDSNATAIVYKKIKNS